MTIYGFILYIGRVLFVFGTNGPLVGNGPLRAYLGVTFKSVYIS